MSGDVTMWEPVIDHSKLKVGDVVFCNVQPSGYFYGHVIHGIGVWENGRTYWNRGNLRSPPNINSYCDQAHI